MNSTDTHAGEMTHTAANHRQPATAGGTAEVHRLLIRAPLAGVDLTEEDERLVAWPSSWDYDIVEGIGRLLHRARRAGREGAVSAPDPSLRTLVRHAPDELQEDILRCLASFQRLAAHRAGQR